MQRDLFVTERRCGAAEIRGTLGAVLSPQAQDSRSSDVSHSNVIELV
jgi:hypothetical protein